MRLKIGFLVRRKMRRWSQGKGPLSKEQLDCLDRAILKEYWTNGSDYLFSDIWDWNLTKIRDKNE